MEQLNLKEQNQTSSRRFLEELKKEGPLALINKVRKRLGDRNNTMISKIMSLGVDLLTGKKTRQESSY